MMRSSATKISSIFVISVNSIILIDLRREVMREWSWSVLNLMVKTRTQIMIKIPVNDSMNPANVVSM